MILLVLCKNFVDMKCVCWRMLLSVMSRKIGVRMLKMVMVGVVSG